MSKEMEWARALLEFTKNRKRLECPSCGSISTSCTFKKNEDNNIGCAICKCTNCGDTFVMSRMEVPGWAIAGKEYGEV